MLPAPSRQRRQLNSYRSMVVLDGVELIVHGAQVRAGSAYAAVTLQTYRCPDDQWRPAITLSEEIKQPMGDAVLAAGLEAELLREQAANAQTEVLEKP